MAGRLRYFLYRDDRVVSQFLEQLEGGVYDEENIRQKSGKSTSAGGGLAAGPVSIKGSRDRSADHETEFSLHQTGASRFSRFHDLASGSGDIQPLDALDEASWDQMEPGEVFEARVTVKLPDILKTLDLAGQASKLMLAFDAFGAVAGADGKPLIDPDQMRTVKRQLPVVEHFAAIAAAAPVPVTANLASDPTFKFFVNLNRDNILVASLQELEGEARLVASIQSNVECAPWQADPGGSTASGSAGQNSHPTSSTWRQGNAERHHVAVPRRRRNSDGRVQVACASPVEPLTNCDNRHDVK